MRSIVRAGVTLAAGVASQAALAHPGHVENVITGMPPAPIPIGGVLTAFIVGLFVIRLASFARRVPALLFSSGKR